MTAKKTKTIARRAPRSTRASVRPRVQTGLRMDKRLYKVLKGLADYLDISLGDLVELIALRALEDDRGFSKGTLKRIEALRTIHDLDTRFVDAQSRLFVDE